MAVSNASPATANILRRAYNDAAIRHPGLSQSRFGDLVAQAMGRAEPIRQSSVSKWLTGQSIPEPDVVAGIERVAGWEPAALARALGTVPSGAAPAVTVEDAIDQDPGLTQGDRDLLKVLYLELLARNEEPPRPPARGRGKQ